MSIQRILSKHNIPYVTEGNKHCTEGWVNIHCPFCTGSQDYHLGIHEDGKAANCWRCGSHSVVSVLQQLLKITKGEAIQKLKESGSASSFSRRAEEAKVSIFPLRFPKPYSKLTPYYKKYLENRNFDPDYLEEEWGLLQTGPSSFLDNISYSHRILIPIRWNGEIVSFQGRDITGKSERKYLACSKRREKIHHKNILYGKQEQWKTASGIIVVEGVTDVWRLGPGSVATFGIKFKMEQVMALSKINDRFFIVFDSDQDAQNQAKILSTKLKALGKQVHIEKIADDPGSMKQDDANHLVKMLLKGGK